MQKISQENFNSACTHAVVVVVVCGKICGCGIQNAGMHGQSYVNVFKYTPFKVAVNPKTTNFYNGIARAIFFLYYILSII